MKRPFRILLPATVALAAALSGCVVVPAGGYRGTTAYEAGPVMVAPPAPQVELIGVAPGPGYFWIGGYWNWYGGRHVWTGGHWEAPRPGYQWVPHRWHQEGQGWRAAPGHWARR